MTTKAAAKAAPKRGRPVTLAPGDAKAVMPVRVGPTDRANIATVRARFAADSDSEAIRRALQYTVDNA